MIAVDAVIVTAMADESAAFLARADVVGDPTAMGHAEHRLLTVCGRQVLLVQCGIGLVNSATAAAVAIQGTHPRAVISAGSAGGVGLDVRVGDVVVGSEYLYSGADARAFGYELGQVPGMPEVYEAEQILHDAAATASVDLRILSGTILSGDAFIDATRIDRMRSAFPSAMATDMESAALAHTAHLYGVPFLSVRGISDLCGPVAGADFLTHVDDAADRSAVVVLEVLRRLAVGDMAHAR
ncbi:5'-methylthioadenosine/S-adenosylhomocysteine nucleosidase [uncultured Cellulomonas sp.]|uniref:5'-methylthioadenosine/S-adenosylhomocysteine nucleosidase n=1 Tax=uncultured Cellulomonas sp. TaxID=189682 RepID=UPI0028E57DB0|nr:5'-methylthioadenosine/S-adenosylhomocysteine nucleosidase [uncultured Cellulomonas sp.]